MTVRPVHAIASTAALLAALAACGGGQESRLQELEQRLARVEHLLAEERETSGRLRDAVRDAGCPSPTVASDGAGTEPARLVEELELQARLLQQAADSRNTLEGQRAMQAIGALLEKLAAHGEQALPLLLSAAEDSEGQPQSTLLEAYARLGGRAVGPILERLLADEGKAERLRFQAARSLVELDPTAAAPHVERLLDREPRFPELYFLVFMLGESRAPSAVPVLCKALAKSEDPSIRCHAATALGNYPDDRAAAALAAAATGDPYPAVRVNALRALPRVAPGEAHGIAREVLESTPVDRVRDAAREILGTDGKGGSR